MRIEVSAPAVLEALMDAGKHLGSREVPRERGRQEVLLTGSRGAGDGAQAEPWWIPKGILQAGGSGRAF